MNRQTLCISLCTLALSFTQSSVFASYSKTKQTIHTDIEQNNIDHLQKVVKKSVDNKIKISKLKQTAKEESYTPLRRALRATDRVQKDQLFGLSKANFFESAFFIETRLSDYTSNDQYYIPKEKTGLKNNLEYCPMTKNTFIILEGKKARLGEGQKKIVTKALFYNDSHPQVVARGEQTVDMKRELQITKDLQNAPGLFQTYGFGSHKAKGKKYTTIYSKLYSPGALETAFQNKEKFSLYEKIKIARNILKGLKTLHGNKMVHRDLGARNYLINIPKGKRGKRNIEACIADLGRADKIKRVKGTKIQGNTSYTAPEGLFRNRMDGKDYYKTDVFAVGLVFYRLLHNGKKAPWQDNRYVKDLKKPLKQRYKELMYGIIKGTHKRRTYLRKKKHLSVKESFEQVIMNMLNPFPNKRESAEKLARRMDKIFDRVKKK